ncbi:MAG: CheR family methyltransferase [Myxococcaceae bacterium]
MKARRHLEDTEIKLIEAVLHEACGFQSAGKVRSTLELAFFRACEAASVAPDVFLERISRREPVSVEVLVEHSVIGETYFSRHPEHYAALKARILPALRSIETIRVWSAGCSSGEEAYDLAACLLEFGRAPKGDVVLGTDISERALKKAREGKYSQWSVRSKTRSLPKWAEPLESGVQVKPLLRESVTFKKSNLVADPAPMSDCHVIFCRNVLIYFKLENVARVLHKLSDSLAPGGWLVLGAAELPNATNVPLQWVDSEGVTLLRKPMVGEPLALPRRLAVSKNLPKLVSPAKPAGRREASKKQAVSKSWKEPTPKAPAPPDLFEQSREAARRGQLEDAETLAKESGEKELRPEAFLVLAMTAESRGDLDQAVTAAKKALFLDANLAMAHATLVSLYHRLGKHHDAERARRNALQALETFGDDAIVPGIEAITAAALRRALENS